MSHKGKRKNTGAPRRRILLIGVIVSIAIIIIGGILLGLVQPAAIEPTPRPVCPLMWAYEDVPKEHVDTLHTIISNAGYRDYELISSAHGENSVCQVDGEIVSSTFLLMDISFTVNLPVEPDTLENPSEMGAMIRQIIESVQEQQGSLPTIYRIDIGFINDDENKLWSDTYSKYKSGIPADMTNEALFANGSPSD